jgi:ABC-type thiamine transport system ATPase subunit
MLRASRDATLHIATHSEADLAGLGDQMLTMQDGRIARID